MYWWFVILSVAAGWSFCLIYQQLRYKFTLNLLRNGTKDLKEMAKEVGDEELLEKAEAIEEMETIIETAETLAFWLEMMQKGRLKVDKKLTREEWLDVAVTAVDSPESVTYKKEDNKKSR